MAKTDVVIRWSEEAMEHKDRCERAGFALSAICEYTSNEDVPIDHKFLNVALNRVMSILQGGSGLSP